MNKQIDEFSDLGYVVLDDLMSASEIDQIDLELSTSPEVTAGDRRFLDREWCRLAAHVIRLRLLKRRLLYLATQPVLCIYFNKNAQMNWGVGLHRDLHLPFAERVADPNWHNWSEKQGIWHAHAPRNLLASMIIVRVHIDTCERGDGELSVVPGSHISADVEAARVSLTGQRGSAVIMSPLLLHASLKSESARSRRILHFVYGPSALPDGLRWYYTP